MDLTDRLLGHDAWTTRRLLALCEGLADEQLDRDFDLGHRTLRATLLHVVRNVEAWTDLMTGRPVRPDPAGAEARSIAGLLARQEQAAAEFGALARGIADRGAWEERWLDVLDDPPAEKTFGGAIGHVLTHSMHHRAQAIHMLRRLGVEDVPEGDLLGWEARHAGPARSAAGAAPGEVMLREIDDSNLRAICRLAVRPEQQGFVAPNAVSIAQAHFAAHAWFRAIYVAETPVGFVMLSDRPEKPEYFLWRFMIDARHQGAGIGRRAIELVLAHVRTRPGATHLLTSAVPGPGSPQPFYERLGFVATGEVDDGEVVLRLDL